MNFDNKSDKAAYLFKDGYNCSQAVVGAFADEIGVDFKQAMLLSSSFGGGMGRLREVCGAVTGMFMVLGLKFGYDDPKAFSEKSEHYKRIQDAAAKFKEKNNSIICRELLGLGNTEPKSHTPEKRTESYYKKRPCVDLVRDATEITEFIISELGK